jgi:hypothetical protein
MICFGAGLVAAATVDKIRDLGEFPPLQGRNSSTHVIFGVREPPDVLADDRALLSHVERPSVPWRACYRTRTEHRPGGRIAVAYAETELPVTHLLDRDNE